jgi:hypothetical protein
MRVPFPRGIGTVVLGVLLILMFAGAMSLWSLPWEYS